MTSAPSSSAPPSTGIGPRRLVRKTLRVAATGLARALHWAGLERSASWRMAVFDAAPAGSVLVSTRGPETYLVSSGDRAIARELYVNGQFDFEKLQKVMRLLGPGFQPRLLLDIGANIGCICIAAVKRGLFERAMAFEPEPYNFSLLAANIHLNGLASRITPRNLALGARDGEQLVFELSKDNYGDHRISMGAQDGQFDEACRERITVPSESLDSQIEGDWPGCLIWMDTQGFEGYVLQGAARSLRERPPLVVEFWPYGMQRSGSYEALKHAVLQAGYTHFHDLELDEGPVPASEAGFDAVWQRLGTSGRFTDLLIQ
ncbi:FkbM family methyltransferase [Roseateles sp.]|uniref:FkbM family methyltransferase n=1 Tax=Roseateles sp. TaxID=1971397 RepID=UPI0039ECD3D8